MTILFLRQYEQHLRDKYDNSVNTVNTDLKSFRQILNQAVDEELLPYEKIRSFTINYPGSKPEKYF